MFPVHVAVIDKKRYLFLRKNEESFQWFEVSHSLASEAMTSIKKFSCEEALRAGYTTWKDKNFRFMHCGFRYTLPERDQVGTNALFWQMALSYNSSNGRYFDEELGHLCYVDFASQEALDLWRKIKSANTSI